MGEVLIVYSPTEEHVAVAAQQLRRAIERRGHEVRACRVDEAPTAPMGYDLVLVGASTRPGQRHDDLVRWVRGNLEQLRRRESVYFEVSLASSGATTAPADDVVALTGWTPQRVWRFSDYDDVERCGDAEIELLEGWVPAGSA